MSTEEDAEPEYDLVMPFVVCTTQGGPFDDKSFVAGYMAGLLDEALEQKPDELERWVLSALVPQVDLIAMGHGYAMTAKPSDEHPDEWTSVRLVRIEA